MTANQEIIAELRRVLNERDEARAALAACPDCAMYAERSARFAEQADQLQRERDEANARRDDLRRALEWANEERDRLRERCETLANNHEHRVEEMAALRKERDEARAEVEQMQNRCAHVHGCLDQALEDRDEARAEVDHWKGAAKAHAEMQDDARAEVERLRMMLPVHPSSLTDACTDAYSRGAEAMREACAKSCRPILRSMASRSELAKTIRALPIPEEP